MSACFMVDGPTDDRAVVGAMFWWSHVRRDYDTQPRPMPHLAVVTVSGPACLDCPATDPPYTYWTRTGEPPLVSVTPSLDIGSEPKWHGFLTDGVLIP